MAELPTIAPKLPESRRKNRIVAPDQRQRAQYSCDRCKLKKTKCVRLEGQANPNGESHPPCATCTKFGFECSTTVPRRRRVYSSFESLGTHYQTVIKLVQGLCPEVDINDIEALRKFGQSVGIDMSTGGQAKTSEMEVESKILKPVMKELPKEPQSVKSQEQQETVVIDSSGGTHYVGSSGTPSLFTLLCNLLLKRSLVTTLSFDNKITLFKNGIDRKADYRETYMSILRDPRFPLVRIVNNKETADAIVDVFFKRVHPFYFIFDQVQFIRAYELYWHLLESLEPIPADLPNTLIGCIYLVYLIASKMCDIQLSNSRIEEILQLFIADASLGASMSSIQFLYLYATHLHSEKNRDASWNLIGLAIRQATSLGLHKSIMMKNSGDTKIQSQLLFWSLYQNEMTLCLNFGRQSIINEAEIDVEYPDLSQLTYLTPQFIEYHKSSLQMSRFLSQIVKERQLAQQPLSLINIERTLSLKAQLLKLHTELKIKPYTEITDIYDFKLCLMFHHYMAAITLPLLVYITTMNYKITQDETVLGIVRVGIEAAVIISKILWQYGVEFQNGAVSSDCMMGYNSALLLSLFFIYLSNTSNDLWQLQLETGVLDKTTTLGHIAQIAEFMEKSKLDSTTKRIAEITEGLKNDLNVVALQDDVRFDNVVFEGNDQLVYDALVLNNDIYLDGWF